MKTVYNGVLQVLNETYNYMVQGQLPPRKITPRTIAPEENCLPENCPLTIKFPPKIIASTQGIPLKEYYE